MLGELEFFDGMPSDEAAGKSEKAFGQGLWPGSLSTFCQFSIKIVMSDF